MPKKSQISKPLNILIVEDSQDDTDLILAELRRAGFEPKWKRVQTEQAFLVELKNLPDIVLSDYSMPGFSGLRAAELVKESGLNIPFILISGTVGEDVAVEAMKHGATDYLLKDRIVRLGAAVERALIEKRLRNEHQQVETSLNLFRALLDRSIDGIEVIDPQTGRFLDINTTTCLRLGYTREELLSMTVPDISDAGLTSDSWAKSVENIRQSGFRIVESRHKRKDGSTFPVEINVCYVKLDRDYLIAAVRDITERKQADEELRWKTAFLEAQVDCSIDGILVVDSEGKTILQNQRMNDLWKIPLDIAATEDDAIMVEFVANQTKNPSQFKSRITHLYSHPDEVSRDEIELVDGTILDRYSSPVRDRGGKYYGRIWTFRDITGKKQSEAALRLSEAQLRATFENAAIGIALVNPDGRPAKCNPALVRMLGYSEAELCGMGFSEFTHPEDVEMDVQLFQSLLRGERDHYEIEKRFIRKDSQIILGRLKVSLVKQPDSTSPPAIGMVEDITEQRKLEDQFRQSQKMEAFGQLAGGVAHDFNNILAVIQLQAGLLKSGRNLSPEELNFAEDIGKAAERGANLTRQLLLFSRKQTLQPRNLKLKELVANITRMLERTLGEHVQLQFKFSEEPLCIHADPGMIDQILLNLTVNARDAMPKGGEIIIETSAAEFDEASATQTPQARAGRFVCLSVTDSGCGIPPEVLPRIFEPFYTTKEVGKGTGLGLATVFGIVQQHGGWINVYSEVGRGTTFRIYLPRLASTSDTKFLRRSRGPIRGGTETILLVEDEPTLRSSVVTTLSRLGYRVLEASSGNEAVEVWKQHRDEIRLLLTDLVMPSGMTGRELAAQLLQQNPKLKVVYSSGYSAEIVGKDFSPKENVNFLTKPYEAEKLAQTIRNSLDGLMPAT